MTQEVSFNPVAWRKKVGQPTQARELSRQEQARIEALTFDEQDFADLERQIEERLGDPNNEKAKQYKEARDARRREAAEERIISLFGIEFIHALIKAKTEYDIPTADGKPSKIKPMDLYTIAYSETIGQLIQLVQENFPDMNEDERGSLGFSLYARMLNDLGTAELTKENLETMKAIFKTKSFQSGAGDIESPTLENAELTTAFPAETTFAGAKTEGAVERSEGVGMFRLEDLNPKKDSEQRAA